MVLRVRIERPAETAARSARLLSRCRRLRAEHDHEITEAGKQLLRRVTFAAYADLRDLAGDAPARLSLSGHREAAA